MAGGCFGVVGGDLVAVFQHIGRITGDTPWNMEKVTRPRPSQPRGRGPRPGRARRSSRGHPRRSRGCRAATPRSSQPFGCRTHRATSSPGLGRSGSASQGSGCGAGRRPVTTASGRGMLDTLTVILLGRIDVPTDLPRQSVVSAVTLAELSVGPHVARTARERVARQAHLQQAESVLPSTRVQRAPSAASRRHCARLDASRPRERTTP